jgi:hypothetical protein
MAYDFEGSMLEACSCHVICPCWAGQTPDGGTCEGSWPITLIGGSPMYVGKAPAFRANVAQYGFNIDLQGHSAVQGAFRFAA